MDATSAPKPGHGDHWLALLDQGDPRLPGLLAAPPDAPAGLRLHRSPFNAAIDLVQVTREGRLVTAYPEPRATSLVTARPVELALWETRAEGWITIEHPGAGFLTAFVTDLAESAAKYAAAGARGTIDLELSGIAYAVTPGTGALSRLEPAARKDARFLPDDYAFHAELMEAHPADDGEVLDLAFHGELAFPVVHRAPSGIVPGGRASGYLWLTARLAA